MTRLFAALIAVASMALPALADSVSPRAGWSVAETSKSYTQLIADLKSAVKAHKFGVVTQAGPTKAAANHAFRRFCAFSCSAACSSTGGFVSVIKTLQVGSITRNHAQ